MLLRNLPVLRVKISQSGEAAAGRTGDGELAEFGLSTHQFTNQQR